MTKKEHDGKNNFLPQPFRENRQNSFCGDLCSMEFFTISTNGKHAKLTPRLLVPKLFIWPNSSANNMACKDT
jgi:hypothetical protein